MKKKFILKVVGLMVLLAVSFQMLPIGAISNPFTLDPLPTVKNEVAGHNSVEVSTSEEFTSAMLDESIDQINFVNDIIFEEGGLGYEVNRDLKINGNGYVLKIPGSKLSSPNFGGSTDGAMFNLGTNGTSGVFHIQNLTLSDSDSLSTFNTFVSINEHANGTWDVIFEQFYKPKTANRRWNTMLDTPIAKPNTLNLFIRDRVIVEGVLESYFKLSGNLIIESNARLQLNHAYLAGISAFKGNTYNVFFGENSSTSIASAEYNLIPDAQQHIGNAGAIAYASNIDLYKGSSVTLFSESTQLHNLSTLYNISENHGMNIRIDSNARLDILHTREGSAVSSDSPYPLIITGNPGASLNILSTTNEPTINLKDNGSYISLIKPKYFNIHNYGNGTAISSDNLQERILELQGTNIGMWAIGDNSLSSPTAPSPFQNVTLISTMNSLLEGSSEILNTLPPELQLSNLSRISYVDIVSLQASNFDIQVGQSQDIDVLKTPNNAELTFTSSDTNVLTIDANGRVTGVNTGKALITIEGSYEGMYSSTIQIEVNVYANAPILSVPILTQIDINDDFNPRNGISATDFSGKDITENIEILNNIDTSKAGIYTLQYSVTDSQNNTTLATSVVLVNDGTYVYDNGFIIHANDITLSSSEVSNLLDADLLKLVDIQVYDVTTREFIVEPEITIDRSKLLSTPGVYPVTFNYNPSITIDITVVKDEIIDVPGGEITDLPNTGQQLAINSILGLFSLSAMFTYIYKSKRSKR